jgi:DNA-binding IclR family transcriptional regulator
MRAKKPTYRAPALDKGLDILEILARTVTPMTMSEISTQAGRSRGEIFRMLQVLENRRYISRNGGDGYALTNKLFMLGMERPPVRGLADAALPITHRLAEEIWQPCHLVVPSQEQIVVIARVEAPDDLGLVVRVGHRRPLVASSSGLVLLAFQDDGLRLRWLDLATAGGIRYNRAALLASVAQVRARGYARVPSPLVPGVVDLSAPITPHGSAVAAVTVPFLNRPRVRVAIGAALAKVRAAAREISTALAPASASAPPPIGRDRRALRCPSLDIGETRFHIWTASRQTGPVGNR